MANPEPASITTLASRLGKIDVATFSAALEIRQPRSVGVRDAFDLAETLLSQPSIDRALARFTASELVEISRGFIPHGAAARCENLLIAVNGVLFPEIVDRAAYWTTEAKVPASSPAPETQTQSLVPVVADEARFTEGLINVLVLNDVLALIENIDVRTTRNGHLNKASVVELSMALPHSDVSAAQLVEWGRFSGLLEEKANVMRSRSDALSQWQILSTQAKWLWLARRAIAGVPEEAIAVITASRGDVNTLRTVATETFPIDSSWLTPTLEEALLALWALGLASTEQLSEVALEALRGDDSGLEELARDFAPTEVTTFLVQQDMSIMTPGPLTTAVGQRLDTMAQIESRGLASTYRLTSDSLRRALNRGETGASITAFLTEHSVTPVPQNVMYLVNEIAERHGDITLVREAIGTYLRTVTPKLLDSLIVDSSLKALQLNRVGTTEARTRVDADTVVRLAEDAGYPRPVLLMESKRPTLDSIAPASNPWEEFLRRIQSGSADAPTGLIGRQIELAVRAKQRIRVTVAMPDGNRDFVLDPSALANGRLRGRDVRGAVERTLPIEFITDVAPAE